VNATELLATITSHYLGGRDFNGYPLRDVASERADLDSLLRELVESNLISLHFGAPHPNPYIKAFPGLPADIQMEMLTRLDDITHLTAYPERAYLDGVVEPDEYVGRPFSLRMALGEAALVPAYFDLRILEYYRNDPRYYYTTNELSGTISVSDDYYETTAMRDADKVLIQSFGYGYNEEQIRAVCVFTTGLHRLTPEHQQIWAAQELPEGYKMHPAYFASAIQGEFPDGPSMFEAFTEELEQLQKMCAVMGVPPIVRETFKGERKPANFSFLIRPTLKELQDFHSTLDKMMSDNLNVKFFEADGLALEAETERKDGKVEVARKGTISLLAEWTDQITFPDPRPKDLMIKTFREVRRLRQRPAHAADDNTFNLEYYKQQRQLMVEAYRAIRTLRLILENHPDLAAYDEVPEWLAGGTIYSF